MKKWLLAILFATVLTLAACGGDDTADEPADSGDTSTEEPADNGDSGDDAAVDTAAGEEVYQANCAMCHGADLSGGAGPDIATAGDNFSAEELEDIIVNGTGTMPAQNVSGDDLDALVGWLAEQK